jgi:hypothetical protein
MGQGRDSQEGRILPAAVRGVEHPAVRGVHKEGAEKDRQQRNRDEAPVEAGQDGEAAEALSQEV